MIIQDKETTLETIGTITDEAQFKMRNSQKAFQILSSLYSDKPLAIVRELGCNAMDSHIASGQPNRPFHVHVPNLLEPWLTIQDFGTGISHENIYEIYSVYFASTKTNTNTQVGMLGLGSKSPFCYTDNFTITSRHLGAKRVYNAYFNQQGMPTISLACQNNTDEENGVEIKIPVKQNDIGDFYSAISNAFKFFDVKPTISGGQIEWNDKPNFEGTFWKSFTNLHQSYAIMGGVAYPIDTYKVDSKHYDIVRKAGLVIQFAIGELDVTPSRESLMYHDWVVKAINDKIALVKQDFVAKVEDQIKNSDNLLDAMKALYLLNNQWSFLNSTLITGKVMWKNVEITEPRKSLKTICQNNIKSYYKRQWGRAKWGESEYPNLDNKAVWYVDDLKRGSVKRVLASIKAHGDSGYSANLVDETGMKALIKAGFPASAFVPTSTLPAIASTKSVVRGTKTTKPKGIITIYKTGCGYQRTWESVNLDLSGNAIPDFYIIKDPQGWEFNAGVLLDSKGNGITSIKSKSTLKEILDYLKIDDGDFCMVSKRNASLLEALGSKSFVDYLKTRKVNFDSTMLAKSKLIDDYQVRNIIKNKKFSKMTDSNPFKKMILEFKQILDSVKDVYEIKKFIPVDEKISLTFPSKLVELMYLACGSYQVGVEKTLDAALELE